MSVVAPVALQGTGRSRHRNSSAEPRGAQPGGESPAEPRGCGGTAAGPGPVRRPPPPHAVHWRPLEDTARPNLAQTSTPLPTGSGPTRSSGKHSPRQRSPCRTLPLLGAPPGRKRPPDTHSLDLAVTFPALQGGLRVRDLHVRGEVHPPMHLQIPGQRHSCTRCSRQEGGTDARRTRT